MKQKIKNILAGVTWLFVLAMFVLPGVTNAATVKPVKDALKNEIISNLVTSAPGNEVDPRSYIIGGINTVLSLLGIIFIILVLIAGYMYMTAGGDSEQTQKAVKYLRNAIIGLFIVLSAFSITAFVMRGLQGSREDTVMGRLFGRVGSWISD